MKAPPLSARGGSSIPADRRGGFFWLALVVLATSCTPRTVLADHVDDVRDALHEGNRAPFCEAQVRFLLFGRNSYLKGSVNVFKLITQAEVSALDQEHLPRDAMYIISDYLSQADIDFIARYAERGWLDADARKAAGEDLVAVDVRELAATLFEQCMLETEM